MKITTIISILVIIGFTNQLKAQAEFPILNAKWCYQGVGDLGQDLGNSCFTTEELIETGGQTYSKINYRSHPDSNTETILYRSENGQFYVLPQDSINEILVYDFNLEIGDTFQTNWGWGLTDSIELVVQNLEYITTLDGVLRKKITLENGGYYGRWIEGIGNLEWVFVLPNYEQSVSGGYNFICHSHEEALIYPNSAVAEDCDFVDNTNELANEVSFDIYPTPVKNNLTIALKNIGAEYLTITDMTGQVILKKRINLNQNFIEISHHLIPGVYLISIVTKDESFLSKKFIKI